MRGSEAPRKLRAGGSPRVGGRQPRPPTITGFFYQAGPLSNPSKPRGMPCCRPTPNPLRTPTSTRTSRALVQLGRQRQQRDAGHVHAEAVGQEAQRQRAGGAQGRDLRRGVGVKAAG